MKQLMELLSMAGVKPILCTQNVPVSGQGVKCGMPTEIFDEDIDDFMRLPKALVGLSPEMMVPVSGDSMIDAGYEDGDLLLVRFGVSCHDLDNVLAMVDGLCTVKTLMTDELGQKWLVPRNVKYRAIALSEDMEIKILGVVKGVQKQTPRPSAREILQIIRRTKNELQAVRKLSNDEVDACIVTVGKEVKHARQWYAVQRTLVDCEQAEEGDFNAFCERVARLLPDHDHLPIAKELSRMAVFSFAKPVALWDVSNAPVAGKWFQDYRSIALLMKSLLTGMKEQKSPTAM